MNKVSGVYKITNTITNDFYIGSSKNIKQRWTSHRSSSTWDRCPNSRMYQDMAQYGLNSFKFEIIEETETDNLLEKEQYYIDALNPSYNNYRADGRDIKRCRESHRERCRKWHDAHPGYTKEYYEAHRDEKLAMKKEYYKNHRNETLDKRKEYYKDHRNEKLTRSKEYYNKLCLYKGETLTLITLSARFRRQGISHATLEAKKYLLDE